MPRSIFSTCGAPAWWPTGATGKFIYYRLADDAVLDLLAALRRIAERNVAEVERLVRSYFNDRDSLEPVSREELLERLRAGAVTVLDVRPRGRIRVGASAWRREHPAARA